ncbi:MAG: flavodoxin-dependent (E)-4-hydroxy-3-methylbut-2-enyl-diphosphate synthase [Firmicutes bacterium]|nr:flavodoxin-dependent (E)-4-hydroxy-3-methylbut-2-enyl-diphosphate synthase [Bacillota bacterium]
MVKKTKEINVGGVKLGAGNKVVLQSMTNVPTSDADRVIAQINALADVGASLVRVAVPCMDSASALKQIVKRLRTPICADIHFDYKLAIASIKNGASKIRINPGNIGSESEVKKVLEVAREYNVPIRVGVNSGSLDKEIEKKYASDIASGKTYVALAESALKHIALLERDGFYNIVASVKSSCVSTTIDANIYLASKVNYPLHIGVTEAGTYNTSVIKSSVAIGTLLKMGIGDTIRVSITGEPTRELAVAKSIVRSLGLSALGVSENYVEVVSCPTCARVSVDIESIANEVERLVAGLVVSKKHKVAIMGCVVNGPGEAKDASLGIACGDSESVIFKNGKPLKKVANENLLKAFLDLLKTEIK